jgi:hypothetical protein
MLREYWTETPLKPQGFAGGDCSMKIRQEGKNPKDAIQRPENTI